MNVDLGTIVESLKLLGLKNGDAVLVHSSLSSFGYVEGGSETVIKALIRCVGEEGTIVIPTLTGKREDGPDNPPVFDVRNTPCWTGRIPNEFMKDPRSKRSLHPTHSVSVIGPLTEFLIKDHENSITPCGKESPYYRLAQKGGYILLIGVNQESNSTLHTVEEIAKVPYHMQKMPTNCVIIDYNGNKSIKSLYLHDWGTPRNFQVIDNDLEKLGIMRKEKCGNSTLRLIKSIDMIEYVLNKLIHNPEYLVKK
ncbi:MAG: AAC(3) family N-acetyltransferase [Thermotogae bacterium]|jgi:aminoglycoside 3-N-acetyltransferase|nr:AAC(3) family N-acetyltransferase [Thermotogota bacterium]